MIASILRPIVHYGLHFAAPFLWAMFFRRERRVKAALVMMATMLVDLDHLLADPIFDPDRMSVGFHFLHQYPFAALYFVMCLLPYSKMHCPWWLRAVGVGLTMHMLTDLQDFILWMH